MSIKNKVLRIKFQVKYDDNMRILKLNYPKLKYKNKVLRIKK